MYSNHYQIIYDELTVNSSQRKKENEMKFLISTISLISIVTLSACGGGGGNGTSSPPTNTSSPPANNTSVNELPAVLLDLEERTFAEFETAYAGTALAIGALNLQQTTIPNSTVEYSGVFAVAPTGVADPTGYGNASLVVDFDQQKYGGFVYDLADTGGTDFGDLNLEIIGEVSGSSLTGTISGSGTIEVPGVAQPASITYSGNVNPADSSFVGADAGGMIVSGTMTSTVTYDIPGSNPTTDNLDFSVLALEK